MPRLIDTDARRRDIAEATWRLIERGGLDAVSVRGVAKEAGLSAGSLRHVFSTQSELLGFAMATLGDAVMARFAAPPEASTSLERAESLLSQLLPLDPRRHREAEVWLAFVSRARVDPTLHALAESVDATLRDLVHQALAPLSLPDAEVAEAGVYALVDGLALHAVLAPHRTSPDTLRRVLRDHLQRLDAGSERSAVDPALIERRGGEAG